MKRTRIILSLLLSALAGFTLLATFSPLTGGASRVMTTKTTGGDADNAVANDDPDLPPGMGGTIDKAEYLRAREDNIDLLRGRPYNLPYDPREAAINVMNAQERKRALTAKVNGVTVAPPTWSPLGPTPIPNGQTSDVSVPVSGRTISIAVHPTDPDTVYAGAAQGGLKKSTDGGATWTNLFDFQLETLAIGSIKIDPTDSSIVYVGTGENGQCADCFQGRGLYIIRNANSGSPTISGPFRQDASMNDVFTTKAIGNIAVNPLDNNVLFVCTAGGTGGNPNAAPANQPNSGIYRTTNAQAANPTFTQLTITGAGDPNRDVIDLVMDPGDPNVVIATVIGASGLGTGTPGDGGIYRTANALDPAPTWVRTRTLPDLATNGRAELSINHNGGSPGVTTVYAAVGEISTTALGGPACTASRAGYVTRSTDGGLTWSAPLSGSTGFCGGQCFYDIAIAATQDNMTIHLGGAARGAVNACGSTDVMKRSTNGGTSFVRNDSTLHADEHALAIAPSNQAVVYTSSDGGIWRSTDNGNTWVSRNTGTYSATQFQSIAIHPTDRLFSIGGTQDNGTNCIFSDGHWTHCQDGDGGYTLIDQNSPDTTNVVMYHTFFNGANSQILFERADNIGFAWKRLGCVGTNNANSTNGINCTDTTLFYAPMALGPGNPNTVYFGSDRLYRSDNKGDNMQVVSQAPIVPGIALTAIGISPQDDKVRIVGTRNGRVFRTTTGALTLDEVTGANFPPFNPLQTTRKPIGRAVIDPNNKNTAYVTFTSFAVPSGQHIFKTTNLSDPAPTWTPAGNGIPDIPVDAFAVDPQNSSILYAGTDIGVYQSTDAGMNWTPYGTALPRVAVFDMAISNVHRVLRIATHGRGFWEIPISGQVLPVIRTDSTALTAENCGSPNGNIDPGETVTVNYTVRNVGPGSTTDLVVTLLAAGGVTSPSVPQDYGVLGPNATFTQPFTFTASGSCGGVITLTFQFQDGPINLGTQTVKFVLGTRTVGAPAYSENFDAVTPPALPPGWTSSASVPAVAWASTTAVSDTAPNSVGAFGSATPADNSLTSATVAIPNAPLSGTNPRVQMSFRNFFNTEGGFDGMVLEIAINGSATFVDIVSAGGSFEQNGYTGTLGPTDHALSGRQGWTGNSGGFITTLVNLPPSSYGQNAQFRWRAAWDTGNNTAGAGIAVAIDTIQVYTVTQICCVQAPAPVSAVSHKDHCGVSGDVDLFNGPRIEPRVAGPNNSHQVIVTFAAPVTASGVSVTSKDSMATATQSSVGNTIVIDLMNVTDMQTLAITLLNVTDGPNTHDASLTMTVLAGDVNQDGVVNVIDTNQVKAASGQVLTTSNFLKDVNVDCRFNIADVNFEKNNAGHSVTGSRAAQKGR